MITEFKMEQVLLLDVDPDKNLYIPNIPDNVTGYIIVRTTDGTPLIMENRYPINLKSVQEALDENYSGFEDFDTLTIYLLTGAPIKLTDIKHIIIQEEKQEEPITVNVPQQQKAAAETNENQAPDTRYREVFKAAFTNGVFNQTPDINETFIIDPLKGFKPNAGTVKLKSTPQSSSSAGNTEPPVTHTPETPESIKQRTEERTRTLESLRKRNSNLSTPEFGSEE